MLNCYIEYNVIKCNFTLEEFWNAMNYFLFRQNDDLRQKKEARLRNKGK